MTWITKHKDVWAAGGGGGGGQGWPQGVGGKHGNSCGKFSDPGTSCTWPDGQRGSAGLRPYVDDKFIGDEATSGSQGGDGANNTLTLANGSITTRGGDGGDGGRWGANPQAQGGNSPSYTSSVPTTQVALANPQPGGSSSAGGVAIADKNYTNWDYGTWHDGSRIFGNISHISPG